MHNTNESKYISVVLFAILVFSLSLHLPGLFLNHIENDEVIYQTLAEKLSKNPLDYTLQGTYIVHQLPENYNQPLFFFHPPLFCLLLAFIKIILGIKLQILVPIISSVLTVLLVFLIAKELYNKRVALLAAGINSLCPISLHASTKIWMDSTLVLFVTFSVYMAILSLKKQKLTYYILLGITTAASLMTKLTSLIIIPLIFYILLYKNITKKKIIYTLCGTIVTLILISPWFYWFYKTFGTLYPWWLKQNPELLGMFPFTKMTTERPFHFYITNLIFVAPIYIFSLISIVTAFRKGRRIIESLWVISFIGLFIFTGYAMKIGYVMRYILACVPALAILAAEIIMRKNKIILYIISILFLGYGLLVGILNSFMFQVADVFPFTHFSKSLF